MKSEPRDRGSGAFAPRHSPVVIEEKMIRAELKFDKESIRMTALEKVRSHAKILHILPWLGVAVVFAAIFSWFVERNTGDAIIVLLIGLSLIISKRVTICSSIRQARKTIADRTYAIWEFSDKGVKVKSDGFEADIHWKNVKEVRFFKRLICLEFVGLAKNYIPKNSFQNDSAIEDFRRLLVNVGVKVDIL